MYKKDEKFRGGRGGGIGPGGGAVLAGGVLGASSSGGDTAVIRCPSSDTSFHCKLTRFTQNVRMILFLIIIFVAIIAFFYFIYNYFMKNKKR